MGSNRHPTLLHTHIDAYTHMPTLTQAHTPIQKLYTDTPTLTQARVHTSIHTQTHTDIDTHKTTFTQAHPATHPATHTHTHTHVDTGAQSADQAGTLDFVVTASGTTVACNGEEFSFDGVSVITLTTVCVYGRV